MNNIFPISNFTIDKEGIIKHIDKHIGNLIGFEPGELLNSDFRKYIMNKNLKLKPAVRKYQTGNVKIISRTGDLKVLKYFLKYDGKGFQGMCIDNTEIFIDRELAITEKKHFKNLNNRLMDQLKNLNHDLKTPLSSIRGVAYLMKSAGHYSGDQIDILEKSIDSLNDVLSDIFSDYGIEKKGEREVTFDELVERLRVTFSNLLSTEGIEFSQNVHEKVGSLICDNPKVIIRIFMNLINNALKHAEPNTIEVGIEPRENNGIYGYVSDDGKGLDKKVIKNLFKIKSKAEGNRGRGLWICKRLMDSIGGSMEYENTQKGTRFSIKFKNIQRHKKTGANKTISTVNNESLNTKILLVDDSKLNLEVLKRILTQNGCAVEFAASGQEGLKKLSIAPHIIFMDIQMPGWDGFRTLAEMHKINTGKMPPVIAISGNIREFDPVKYLAHGFSGTMAKPINPERILEIVRKFKGIDNLTEYIYENIDDNFFLDNEIISNLKKFGDDSIVEESFVEFEKYLSLVIRQINSYYIDKKYSKILPILHTIRGDAGTLGLKKMEYCVAVIEFELRSGHKKDMGFLVERLNRLFNEFKGLINKYKQIDEW